MSRLEDLAERLALIFQYRATAHGSEAATLDAPTSVPVAIAPLDL
jgi:hypothetical protein